ncbi:hypothetical protein BGZ73_004308 [Actinomortierella ambigua]|nr:hypothetical protein BGZ73_004308 [Actinomortierella ambigua]
MSSTDNSSYPNIGQQPAQLKYQQHQQPAADPNMDPTLLSTRDPIHQPGYQTNQPMQPPIQYQPPLTTNTATTPNAPLQQQGPYSQPKPMAQQSHGQQGFSHQTAGMHPTDPVLHSTQTVRQQQQQQQQQYPPTQSSLPHTALSSEDQYHLQKLRNEQPGKQQQLQPQIQPPTRTLDTNQPRSLATLPANKAFQSKAVEQLPAATLNDPRHPDSLPTEYKVAPRAFQDSTDIDQHYKREHERRLSAHAAPAGTGMSGTGAAPMPTDHPVPPVPPMAAGGGQVSPQTHDEHTVQKPKFFEVAQALIEGRLPTNAQLDQFLTRVMTSPSMESRAHMLSPDGQSLYRDLKDLLQTLRGVIYEKNEQELFQNLIYHCQSATDTVGAKQPTVSAQTAGINTATATETAKGEAKEILDRLVTVAKLLTTNAEFRAILNDLIDLAREVFGEGANKLSDQARIAGEKLSGYAQSSSQKLADVAQSNQERLPGKIQSATDRVQTTLDQARDENVEGLRTTREELKGESSSQYEAAKKQAADARANLAKQAQGYQERAKDKAVQLQADAKNYAKEKMPPERRRELVERLKVVMGQVQADPQYQSAIESIIHLLGVWRQRSETPRQGITAEATKITDDANVNAAAVEFKVLLQRWAQGYSLDPLIDQIKILWSKARHDPELRQYLDNVSTYVSKIVREPNYVTSSSTVQADTDQLIQHGQELMNVKYQPETESLVHEVRMFVQQLNTDPRSREVSERMQKLAKDLLYDKKGHLTFKLHLLEDLRYVFLPALMESFDSIPIPRIEYADLKVELMFNNMVLAASDLLPRLFELTMQNTIRMVPRRTGSAQPPPGAPRDGAEHDFKMSIQGIQANLYNIEYAIHTKTGIKLKDHGRADLLLGQKGVDIKIHGVRTFKEGENENDRTSLVTFKDIKVKIHNLNIKVHKSDHKVLLTFAQPFIKTTIKRAIAKSIETQIREALTKADKVLATSIRDQRIKTGKNTVGALVDTATSFVTSKVHPDEKTKAAQERERQRGHYDRTSHVVFDRQGLQVLDPIKHIELKVGEPLLEDPNEMAAMSVAAPWVSTAFNMHDRRMPERETMPGMQRPRQILAM